MSAPSVCIPEPNVRSQGTKIALLIDGGMASTKTTPAMIHTARFRSILVLSVTPATRTSNAATSERYPAPKSPAKNRNPKNHPSGMVANTSGSVEKMSAGPEEGSMPSAMIAGMMARPAINPAPASPIAVHTALEPRRSRGPR